MIAFKKEWLMLLEEWKKLGYYLESFSVRKMTFRNRDNFITIIPALNDFETNVAIVDTFLDGVIWDTELLFRTQNIISLLKLAYNTKTEANIDQKFRDSLNDFLQILEK